MKALCTDSLFKLLPALSEITGLWNSSDCLGTFLGPTIGGMLIDNYGYKSMAFCFVGISCLVISANVKELWNMMYPKRRGQYMDLKIFHHFFGHNVYVLSDLLYPPLLKNQREEY